MKHPWRVFKSFFHLTPCFDPTCSALQSLHEVQQSVILVHIWNHNHDSGELLDLFAYEVHLFQVVKLLSRHTHGIVGHVIKFPLVLQFCLGPQRFSLFNFNICYVTLSPSNCITIEHVCTPNMFGLMDLLHPQSILPFSKGFLQGLVNHPCPLRSFIHESA